MMQAALSQICSLNSSFESDVEGYAAGHCTAIEVWLTKLETFLQTHSIDDVQQLLEKHSVSAPVASLQGGLLDSQGETRSQSWELFKRRLELCRQLGIATLVVACDVVAPLTQSDVERVQTSLRMVADEASQRAVRVALEFQAHAALGNNLQTAAALVEEVGSASLGICLDAFHFYVGPSKAEDLGQLTSENLFHVQFCDLADVPREFAKDADRILPGEGDIPLQKIVERLCAIDYRGCVSVELMNPQIWSIPARSFGEIAITALRKVLGQAAMK